MSVEVQFAALADATRCRVLELLHERPRPVHDLADAFSISGPAISRDVRVLMEAGLVKELKLGRENVYSLQPLRLRQPADWLNRHLGNKAVPKKAAAPKKAAPKTMLKKTAPPKAAPREAPPVAPQIQLDLF